MINDGYIGWIPVCYIDSGCRIFSVSDVDHMFFVCWIISTVQKYSCLPEILPTFSAACSNGNLDRQVSEFYTLTWKPSKKSCILCVQKNWSEYQPYINHISTASNCGAPHGLRPSFPSPCPCHPKPRRSQQRRRCGEQRSKHRDGEGNSTKYIDIYIYIHIYEYNI